MEQLIQFILNNFVFVIIVLGFLASLFRRSNGKGGGRRTNRMPDFGGGGRPGNPFPEPERRRDGRKELYDEEDEQPGRYEPEPWQEEPRQPARPPAEPARTPAAAVIAPVDRGSARAKFPPRDSASYAVPKDAGDTGRGLTPNADDLRRAVVWSEILGPPRAKRPLRK